MASEWSQILNRLGADAAPGASTAEMDRLEQEIGLPIPPDLRSLLAIANGADVQAVDLHLFSLDEIRQHARQAPAGLDGLDAYFACTGYLAFAEANDSNPFCVCSRGPLSGFVLHVRHDDDTEVAFRNLGAFFSALERLAGEGEAWIDDLLKELGDDRSQRTPDDDRRALELLQAADRLDRAADQRLWLIILGMQLLSARSVEVVERYLEDEYFVRRTARQALRAMNTDEARKALLADDRAVASFAGEVLGRLRGAGLQASETGGGGGGITLLPGPVYLDLNAQFHRRAEPEVVEEIVRRARQAIDEQQSGTRRR